MLIYLVTSFCTNLVLPIQFFEMIGYSNRTFLIYGYTSRMNVIEWNQNKKPTSSIITKERWAAVKSEQFLFINSLSI